MFKRGQKRSSLDPRAHEIRAEMAVLNRRGPLAGRGATCEPV